ncbi:MAG: DUF3429 domain-containing protein [Hyphomicrobiales bacterium]|nr:DUF3429 domain-containing protein [Hyphomicrobiales bacterium]
MNLSRTRSLRPALTYLGAAPFLICALCLALGLERAPLIGEPAQAAASYGLTIASFLAGAHWGQHMWVGARSGIDLRLSSVGAALAAWGGYLWLSPAWFFVALIAVFGALLFVDALLRRADLIDEGYFRLRGRVTAIVAAALAVSAAASSG